MWGCSTCKPTLKRKGCMNVGAFVFYSFYVTCSKCDFFNAGFPKSQFHSQECAHKSVMQHNVKKTFFCCTTNDFCMKILF